MSNSPYNPIMKAPAVVLLCGSLVLFAMRSEAEQTVTLTGFVTRVASPSDFDVNAIHIQCGPGTEISARDGQRSHGCPAQNLYVGEPVVVHGKANVKDRSIAATQLELKREQEVEIHGSAVIEALPDVHPSTPQDSLLVRADGYRILITSKTQIACVPPLGSLADVRPGNWIEYKGILRSDGTVATEAVTISPAAVGKAEGRFRKKSEYDPSNVPAEAQQNQLHQEFIGPDYKHIPPYDNAAMQSRVKAIGEKLIPAFQQNLPAGDPAKIDFRFEVTDDSNRRDLEPLPSGVILIPHNAVIRMRNDSQLAALLADSIAQVLEREAYRMRGALDATTFASGLLTSALYPLPVGGGPRAAALKLVERQSGRVSLGLLHDAGFDIDQAPIAWWLLASADPQEPISEIPLPERAANLYRVLGEEWHNPAAAPANP